MKVDNVKGTRDILPDEMLLKERISNIIKSVFKKYGFVPLKTPALENFETLNAKGAGGEEIRKETYNFTVKGKRLGLRFDLTVPLSRFIAMNPQLQFPFKRYQYDSVWRYGEVLSGAGRYREFEQFDIDIIGIGSVKAEAEVLSATVDTFNKLGLRDFRIKVNNRKLLNDFLKMCGVKAENYKNVLVAIDKLDKKSVEEVRKEIMDYGINKSACDLIFKGLNASFKDLKLKASEGYKELSELFNIAKLYNMAAFLDFDLSLARGLDYYTGTIFEVKVKGSRSLAGGGRYDNMIGLFSGKSIPAVGISLGIDTIIDVMLNKGLVEKKGSDVEVFIAVASGNVYDRAVEIARKLRDKVKNIELELLDRSLKAQLRYADKKGFERVIIIGERDLQDGCVVVRNLKNKKEERVKITQL